MPVPPAPAPCTIENQRPAFVGHSFGGGTVLQVLSDERERGSNRGIDADTGVVSEDTGYSMAFIMDAWTYPSSDEARAQSIDIPVRLVARTRPWSA